MYKLDRTRRIKIVFLLLTIMFFILSLSGLRGGGYEIITYGFMNEPLASIVMVSSFFCAVVCLGCFFALNSIEKDIAEWLEILDRKN